MLLVGGVVTYHRSRPEHKQTACTQDVLIPSSEYKQDDDSGEDTHQNRHTQPYGFSNHSGAATNLHSDREASVKPAESSGQTQVSDPVALFVAHAWLIVTRGCKLAPCTASICFPGLQEGVGYAAHRGGGPEGSWSCFVLFFQEFLYLISI